MLDKVSAYIFEKTPPVNQEFLIILGVLAAMVIAGIASWFLLEKSVQKARFYKVYRTKFFNAFFYPGIIGLFLIFFRWQQIAYLGSRFFTLIIAIVFLTLAMRLVYYHFVVLMEMNRKHMKEEIFRKYLPHVDRKKK